MPSTRLRTVERLTKSVIPCRSASRRNPLRGSEVTVPADTVVVASGLVPDRSLADAIEATGRRVHVIGDSQQVGLIEGATRSALAAALAIG